ncbi:Fe-only nitrogenase accessory protein AnfO [Trichlorobacter thiogenes]|uniref:Fe-only nitrogenase accessory protein AnfO n=1 Tax=Trichlorobacter thiogenes TaxID=115783 RepID=A0A1T4RGS3_9BACT|nr:Fe-only nitrogenase accessory protein AnfO [Trichlorobacter thiogenes]SKA15109.1 Fe-only nitrogenase accessory protein AnfO [Trichlorobacter thiogenes]
MEIATYLNTKGAIAGCHEKGRICVYEQTEDSWTAIKEIALEMDLDLSLSEMKVRIKAAIAQLDDCEVFVVQEFRGLLHALLKEEFGFRTWKSEGTLLEQLEYVARHDREFVAAQAALAAAGHSCSSSESHSNCGGGCSSRRPQRGAAPSAPAQPLPQPVPVGDSCDGYYQINLAEILKKDSSLNSKQVLVPFMSGVAFKKLEVLCDHPPRWFSNELGKLNLTVASELPDSTGAGLKVMVVPMQAC